MPLLSLLLFAAVVLGFLSGSLWFFSAALAALLASMYPVVALLIALGGLTYLAYRYYERKH
ncbi:hypothetical protein NOR51B_991 [Luminiphilus syltensis NOR5-1B]|uniref:Uncharacterized protein n=1 Tax=Luminiphilus syltensis NOR5-1B TaxID=565045 RepID=B8KVU2_9GAMM|nr:hypothetical protein [Luminiphilus syltensis]EED35049.1 hypothetical protein NOR51B_991 [Luminiphilus syltensis NOR5-1B]